MTQAQDHNIGFHFLKIAEKFEDRPAIVSPKGNVSYARLRETVLLYALHLQKHGVDRRSCVAVHATLLYNAMAATLALALLGARWCHATQAAFQEKALNITHLVLDSDEAYIQASDRSRMLKIDRTWLLPPAGAAVPDLIDFSGYADQDDPQFLTHSSGTTAAPKFMGWSFKNVMKWQQTVPDVQYPETRPVLTNLFAMLSILGWFYNLSALVRGGTLVPHPQYNYLVEQGVNHVIGSPIQFTRLLQDQPGPVHPLPATAHVTGGAVSDVLQNQMALFFSRSLTIYGSTEAGPVCMAEILPSRGKPRTLGPLVKGAEVKILDETGRERPLGVEGIVGIRTPFLVAGYIGDAKTTAQVFKDGWFYPGDIGRLTEDGEFVIVGRIHDHLNLGGVKADAAAVDETVQAIPGVADGICFLEPSETGVETLALAVQLRHGADPATVAGRIRAGCTKPGTPRPLCPAISTLSPPFPETSTASPFAGNVLSW